MAVRKINPKVEPILRKPYVGDHAQMGIIENPEPTTPRGKRRKEPNHKKGNGHPDSRIGRTHGTKAR